MKMRDLWKTNCNFVCLCFPITIIFAIFMTYPCAYNIFMEYREIVIILFKCSISTIRNAIADTFVDYAGSLWLFFVTRKKIFNARYHIYNLNVATIKVNHFCVVSEHENDYLIIKIHRKCHYRFVCGFSTSIFVLAEKKSFYAVEKSTGRSLTF